MQPENVRNTGEKEMKEYKRYQFRCQDCGDVVHKNVIGSLTENDKKCDKCGTIITETHIAEIKQDSFLLE